MIENTDVKIKIKQKPKDNLKEKSNLCIDASKAKRFLKWQTRLPLETTISLTRQWYIDFYRGYEAKELCKKQIDSYQQI